MLIDLNNYLTNLKTIKGMLDFRDFEDPNDLISEMALATGCHVIVCIYYTAHYTTFTPLLERCLETNKKFYHITEIRGWPLNLTT